MRWRGPTLTAVAMGAWVVGTALTYRAYGPWIAAPVSLWLLSAFAYTAVGMRAATRRDVLTTPPGQAP